MLQSINEEEECLHGCVVSVLVETSTEKIEAENVWLAGRNALFPCHKRRQEIYNCIRPANQIRNNRCDKNESAYQVIGRTSRPKSLPVDYDDTGFEVQTPTQTNFYFGHGFKPAHVFNYIIPAMASTRGCLLFNCFRAHVHASTRCLQSKEVPFRVQQPLRNVPVWPWATR